MDRFRLPTSVVPTRYQLTLTPDLEAASFSGHVLIDVSIREAVSEIFLNACELRIPFARLLHQGLPLSLTVSLDEQTERCRLSLPSSLPPGPAQLELAFHGTLNDKLRGFYRSRFRHPSGQDKWLAATQFQATDARRAFPCWDEPAFKAVFSITLVVPQQLQAISNTALVEEQLLNHQRRLRFADTISMSTYLVAFIVGELQASDPILVGNTPVRVWCVPGKLPLTPFAQQVAVFSLRFFEEYYALPYPSDKLDLLAIPDFAAGAMENLGAITFRETALLLDEHLATHQERERVADVVAHEVAHMWFGDLVTMRWWNGLWLNEAFATFMELLAIEAWMPDWQRWVRFGIERAGALEVDGLQSSRPIEFPVESPHDAEAMFDVLTYDKGASVLRMLEQYLGPSVFRQGVRHYLTQHAFGNTETDDLWHALALSSQLPIPQIMNGWIFQPGYPLITVHREQDQLVLQQQRFRYLPSGDAATTSLWQIPVQLRFDSLSSSSVERVLLREQEIRLPLPPSLRSVLVNEGGHGFYRVHYDSQLRDILLDRLPTLAAIERFNFLNDAWASALAGLLPLTVYLDMTDRFRTDRDRYVWSQILSSFAILLRLVEPADRPSLQLLIRHRLRNLVADLGWRSAPHEPEQIRQLRADLLRAMGVLGDDPATQAEAALFYRGGQADPCVHSALISILAHSGDSARYNEFLQSFRSAHSPQEEHRYLLALAGFRPPALVERTLHSCLDGTVRIQDAPFLLRALLLGVHSRERAWEFFKLHWEEMTRRFPGPGIRRLCEGVLGLTTPQGQSEVRAFFQQQKVHLGGKTLEQFLEQLHLLVELRNREGKALHEYLVHFARQLS